MAYKSKYFQNKYGKQEPAAETTTIPQISQPVSSAQTQFKSKYFQNKYGMGEYSSRTARNAYVPRYVDTSERTTMRSIQGTGDKKIDDVLSMAQLRERNVNSVAKELAIAQNNTKTYAENVKALESKLKKLTGADGYDQAYSDYESAWTDYQNALTEHQRAYDQWSKYYTQYVDALKEYDALFADERAYNARLQQLQERVQNAQDQKNLSALERFTPERAARKEAVSYERFKNDRSLSDLYALYNGDYGAYLSGTLGVSDETKQMQDELTAYLSDSENVTAEGLTEWKTRLEEAAATSNENLSRYYTGGDYQKNKSADPNGIDPYEGRLKKENDYLGAMLGEVSSRAEQAKVAQWDAQVREEILAAGGEELMSQLFAMEDARRKMDNLTMPGQPVDSAAYNEYNAIRKQVEQAAGDRLYDWEQYAERMRSNQLMAAREASVAAATGKNGWAAAGMNLAAVPFSLASGVGLLDVGMQKLERAVMGSDAPIDYNSEMQIPGRFSTTVRDTTAGMIEEKTRGKAGSDTAFGNLYTGAYQLGTSMLDSAAVVGMTMLGIPGGTWLLGGSAGDQAMQNAKERGASDMQALGVGAISAVAEALFEKVGIDNLTKNIKDATKLRHILRSAAKQAIPEATEEGLTNITNLIADRLIMGSLSEYETSIRNYMAQGMSRDDAAAQANKDTAIALATDVIGGAISGGIFGLGGGALNVAFNGRNNAQTEQQITTEAMPEAAKQAEIAQTTQAQTPNALMEAAMEMHSEATATTEVQRANEAASIAFGETGKRAFATLNDGTTNPEQLYKGFAVMYNAGQMGRTQSEVTQDSAAALSDLQARVAYEAGQKDAKLASKTKTEYNKATNKTEDMTYGTEAVHLRDSSQRTGSAYPGGQVSAVEESARRDQSRNTESRPADRGTASLSYGEEVSAASLGIAGGSNTAKVRLVTGGDTSATRAAKQTAKKNGLDLVLFAGGNLEIAGERGVLESANGYIVGNKVFARVDHPKFTADQITRHEAGHARIDRGEIDPNTVRERIAREYGEEELDYLSDLYAAAYSDTGLSAEDIWKECICDSLGDMNIFSELSEIAATAEGILDQVKESAEATAQEIRGPPTGDGGKLSRENGRRAQRGRSIEIETMENNRFQRIRQFGADLPDVWYAYTGKYLYIYKNFSFMDYQILNKISVENQNLSDAVIKEIEDNAIRTAEDFNRRLKDLRSQARRHRGSDDAPKNRGAAVADGGVSGGSHRDTSGEGRGLQESRGTDEIKQKRSTKELSDRLKYLTKRLKTANISKEQKTKIRKEQNSIRRELRERIVIYGADGPGTRLSREFDLAYLTAVESGDMDTAQIMVESAANVAMPDSKIRTEDGRLRTVYHGTNTGDFTVFNPDYIGMSSGDDGFFGMGFYFAYTKGEASYYGAKRVIPAYLDLRNPFNFDRELQTYNGKQARSGHAPDAVALMNFANKFPEIAKDITVGVVKNGNDTVEDIPLVEFAKSFADVIDNKQFDYQELTNGYGEKETLVVADEQTVEYEYGGEKHSYRDYGFRRRFWGEANELDVAYEYLANAVYEYVDIPTRTQLILDNDREFTAALKAMGYDGAIQSEYGDEAVAFYPSQIKSAEPVTYDDGRNVIPLSERFNSENVDIRYSMELPVLDRLEKLIEQYGEIPEGENPFRDIKVPKKTSKDKILSQTVRTILEAKVTPDATIPTLEDMIADEDFSYERFTDKRAMSEAALEIEDKGYATALADWTKAVTSGVVSKSNTALGWALYDQAATANDLKTATDILMKMVEHQRSAAQAVQATRILKKMSPDAQLFGIQRSVSNLQRELREKYKDKAPDLKIDESLARNFLAADSDTGRTKAMQEIYRDIGRQVPSRFIDKWNAWRYLAMLGNVRTHIRNVVGNAAFAPFVAAKNAVATGLEATFIRNADNRTKALIGRGKADRDLLQAAKDDYEASMGTVLGDGKYSDFSFSNKYIEEGRRIFRFKPLEAARKGNSAALEIEDSWFAKPHYVNALAQYCKAHNISADQLRSGKALGPARAYAVREAQKATYRDMNAFSNLFSRRFSEQGEFGWVGKLSNTVMEGVLPFRKTPANILARGVEYSPIGLLKGLTADLIQVKKGNMTGAEAIDHISAGFVGTALVGFGFVLAKLGLVRGVGDEDKNKREFEELQGHQAYALELPDGSSVTLDWLAPEALPFFVGVNWYEGTIAANDEMNMADVMGVISNITAPMLEMSCLQGLNDLIDSVGYASSEGDSALFGVLVSAATSYLTQAFPTILGQGERTAEEERMTTYTDKNKWLTTDAQYTIGKASARIPGWDYGQIPYIDAWGTVEKTGEPWQRAFNNFINPAYYSRIDTSAMEEELVRLYDQVGESYIFPSRAGKYFELDGNRVDLTAEQYVTYATEKGRTSYNIVTDIVSDAEYEDLTDGDKARAIQLAYEYANAVAKTKVSEYQPEGWVAKALETCKNTNLSVARYILAYMSQKGIESLKDKNGKTIATSSSLLKMEAMYNVEGLTNAQYKSLFADVGIAESVINLSKNQVASELAKMRRQAK